MNKREWEKQLKALDESIEHWDRLAEGEGRPGEGPYADSCALCLLMEERHKGGLRIPSTYCAGCIIKLYTGKASCEKTPYDAAEKAWSRYGRESRRFRRCAKKEADFLRSVERDQSKYPEVRFKGKVFVLPPDHRFKWLTVGTSGGVRVFNRRPTWSICGWFSAGGMLLGYVKPPKQPEDELYYLEETT